MFKLTPLIVLTLYTLQTITKSQLLCNNGLRPKDFDGEVVPLELWDERYSELRSQHFAFPQDPISYAPNYIIVPESEEDIQKTISFSKRCGYKIVISSGGHQYSGLSSCDYTKGKCIQIKLKSDTFSKLKIIKNSKDWEAEFEYIVISGPGVSLGDFYNTNNDAGIFIPGGMCETVHTGGHSQSSGHGYLERAFGTMIDYIIQFRIILADGSIHNILEPGSKKYKRLKKANQLHPMNDDIYFAVLGGGPGSWGVVTEYTYWANKNSDHPNSFLWQCLWQYDKNIAKQIFHEITAFFENLTEDDRKYDYSHELLMGQNETEFGAFLIWLRDFFDSIRNWRDFFDFDIFEDEDENEQDQDRDDDAINDILNNRTDTGNSYIIYEAIYNDLYNKRVSMFDNPIRWIIKNVTEKSGVRPLLCFPLPFKNSKILPHLSKNAYYKPQNRITQFASEYLSLDFYDNFVEDVDLWFNNEEFRNKYGIEYGTQMYWADTHVYNPYVYGEVNRDKKVTFMSLILFYEYGVDQDTELIVNKWQNDSWNKWLDPSYDGRFGDGNDIRSIAFTWGNVNIKQTWKEYYFTQQEFQSLINIKIKMDPTDLFSNKFTIPITTEGLEGWDHDNDDNILCCEKAGKKKGLKCQCRSNCDGAPCTPLKGKGFCKFPQGVCCCGTECERGQNPSLDICNVPVMKSEL